MNLLLENINLDWEELREQKQTLLKLQYMPHMTIEDIDAFDGIIQTLDYLQDQAVASGVWSEEEIFGDLVDADNIQ